MTPIQQVMAVTAAINGGKLYKPHIAKEWIDPRTDDVVDKIEPTMKEKVISKSTSKEIRETLESVVAKGTGRPAYVDGYRVGGKTGTAQKVGPDGNYLANNYILSLLVLLRRMTLKLLSMLLSIIQRGQPSLEGLSQRLLWVRLSMTVYRQWV